MADAMNTIIPIVLIFIAVVWLWSQFGDKASAFFSWIKDKFSNSQDRFRSTVSGPKDLIYE